jgi:hypothetical protein
VRVATGVRRDHDAVDPERERGGRGALGCRLLVFGGLLVPAREHDAYEAKTFAVLSVERPDELVPLEEERRVAQRSPVVLAAGHRSVEQLGRVDGFRQARPANRHAVEVLVVELPEIGELDQRGDRGKLLVREAEVVALDLGGLGLERRLGEQLGHGERHPADGRVELGVPDSRGRPEDEHDFRQRCKRRQGGARPSEIDDRLLLVQRALLTREVDTGQDGHSIEPIRPPRTRLAFRRERWASVGPDSRLDCVEDVRDADGLAGSDDLDLYARQPGLICYELLDPLAVDREQVAGEGRQLERGHAAHR